MQAKTFSTRRLVGCTSQRCQPLDDVSITELHLMFWQSSGSFKCNESSQDLGYLSQLSNASLVLPVMPHSVLQQFSKFTPYTSNT